MKKRIVNNPVPVYPSLCLCFAICLVFVVGSGGCAGNRVRTNILIPTMQNAWIGIRTNAIDGGAKVDVLDEFGQSLEAADSTLIVRQWPPVRTAAIAGVESRVVALRASLLERIRRFDLAVKELELPRRPF